MEYRKLKDLKKLDGNPRIIKNKQFETLCDSIRDNPEYFKARPIILSNRTGELVIIAGNQRYEAAKFLKLKEVPTYLIEGLTEEKEREITIRDNVSNGEWDFDLLANDWGDMPLIEWGVDLPESWFGGGELDEPADVEPQIDKAEELNKVWQVKPGDLWLIGEHRLLCGDSTNAEDVARVMGGEKADMVFTDPPYGINAASMTMGRGQSSKPREERLSTGQTWDSDRPDVAPLLSVAARVCIWGGQYFCHQLPISDDWLCWNKKNVSRTFAEFELAWTNYGCRCREIEHHWGGEQKQHITQKPLAVIQWAMEICPDEPQTIIDPFLGSGTTMVAAQNLNRRCFGIEISENYCAVILQRMKDAFPEIEIRRS